MKYKNCEGLYLLYSHAECVIKIVRRLYYIKAIKRCSYLVCQSRYIDCCRIKIFFIGRNG